MTRAAVAPPLHRAIADALVAAGVVAEHDRDQATVAIARVLRRRADAPGSRAIQNTEDRP